MEPTRIQAAKLWREAEQRYSLLKKGAGKLVSWSSINASPMGYEVYVPYTIGIIELGNGERVTSQIVDIKEDALIKDMLLYPTLRRGLVDGVSGLIQYLVKYRP
jgi:uncharacterized OB-fold protein